MRRNVNHQQRGALALKAALVLVLVLTLGISFLLYTFGVLVRPGYIGVRNISFGPGQGYSRAGLKPGVHWDVPFYSQVYQVPSTLQRVNFHRGTAEGEPDAEPLKVPTGVDSTAVEVDISVLYKFFDRPGKLGDLDHGGPGDMLISFGIEPNGWKERVRFAADRILKNNLRKLSASDFYNPELRQQRLSEAEVELRQELLPFGVDVTGVLLRRYTYQNESLEENIFEKNLEAQSRRVQDEQTKLAEVEALYRDSESKGTAAVETLRKKAESDASLIFSEAQRIEAEKKAQGDLLIAKARAEIDKMKAKALQSGIGAEVYVARQLAPVLSSVKGGIVSQSDPYDLDAWMNRLGIHLDKLEPLKFEKGTIKGAE